MTSRGIKNYLLFTGGIRQPVFLLFAFLQNFFLCQDRKNSKYTLPLFDDISILKESITCVKFLSILQSLGQLCLNCIPLRVLALTFNPASLQNQLFILNTSENQIRRSYFPEFRSRRRFKKLVSNLSLSHTQTHTHTHRHTHTHTHTHTRRTHAS